jgi:hypothetical protein
LSKIHPQGGWNLHIEQLGISFHLAAISSAKANVGNRLVPERELSCCCWQANAVRFTNVRDLVHFVD